MRYPQTAAQSAELLRLILPRIARHGGHYVPTAYTIWYEYLAGLNRGLSAALDTRLQTEAPIEQPEIDQLYARHIAARDDLTVEALRNGLSQLLRKLGDIAVSSGEGAAEYAQALAACEKELGAVGDANGLQKVIQTLVSSTSVARNSAEKLRAELEESRAEMQQLREQLGTLHSEALNDPLTGLHNRRGFERTIAELYRSGSDSLGGAALLLADIDKFKDVNDTYGHLFGDQVIRAAAQVLKGAVKGRDVVARFGGEEFIVLLPDTPAHGALALAEQIRTAFGKLRIRRSGSSDYVGQITLSLGVAAPSPGESIEQAIDRADKALYQAKHDGRNCVRFANAGAGAGAAASASSRASAGG